AFDLVTKDRRAQKSEFFTLVNSLELGLRSEQLEWLWKLSDTNADGLLDYIEFAQRIAEVTGISTTAFPVPRDEDVLEPPSPGPRPPISLLNAAAGMSEVWDSGPQGYGRSGTVLAPPQIPRLGPIFAKLGTCVPSRRWDLGSSAQFRMAAAGGAQVEICSRVNDALRRKGQTPDTLFDALAAARVHMPMEKRVVGKKYVGRTSGLCLRKSSPLWATFDTNADGGISREEFKKQLANVQAFRPA
ncbi:unnamed protein product, partial [Symbiodinium microadriaticum]